MAKERTQQLLQLIRDGEPITTRQQLRLIFRLSVPAMLAQLSYILMTYIDAAMVGHLGDSAAASVGLVATSTWLFGGMGVGMTAGFYVQVAQFIGAKNFAAARSVLRQSLPSILLLGIFISSIAVAISGVLPEWLGGTDEINVEASRYFMVFGLTIPFQLLNFLASGMLRSSGNMKIPSVLNIVSCLLDVLFNAVLIFPSRSINLFGFSVYMPGFDLGVVGAALGTMLAIVVSLVCMMYFLLFRSSELCLRDHAGSFVPTRNVVKAAMKIGLPISFDRLVMSSAQVVSTIIVAPLGTIAIAANSFAVTAESMCYMPGYGMGEAATTLVGQSVGARRRKLVWSLAKLTTFSGVAIMTLMGILMFIFAPSVMAFMTPSADIQSLGAEVMRIEAFAEPLYAASIVIYYAFVGAGKTIVPALMNFGSIWLVRLPLAALLAPRYGLHGVWFAMCLELCFRGIIFIIRMLRKRWLPKCANLGSASL
ncbi:MAG: MATE family efflux transporter [Bacteroidales bacterium]|nr:MATE family efflux transporter [Bacteroidales bacterium]